VPTEAINDVALRAFAHRTAAAISGLAAGFAALVPAFQEMRRSFREIGDAYYGVAERAYRDRFSRLPGSSRTKRLRRKREKRVIAWFMAEMERYRREDHGD